MHSSLPEDRCLSVLPAQKKLKFALRFSRSVSITAQTDANTNVDAEREDPPRIQFSLSAYSFPFSSFLLIVCSHRLTAGRVLLRREAGLLWGTRKDVEPGDASLDSLAQKASGRQTACRQDSLRADRVLPSFANYRERFLLGYRVLSHITWDLS